MPCVSKPLESGRGFFVTLWIFAVLQASVAPVAAAPITTPEDKEELKEQLGNLETSIDTYSTALDQRRAHAATLEEELKRLADSIAKEEEAVRLRTGTLELLSGQLRLREDEVARLQELERARRDELAHALEFLREEEEDATVLEVLLGGYTLAQGIGRLEAMTQLQHGIGAELESLGALKRTLTGQTQDLEIKRMQEHSLRRVQELAGRELEHKRRQKDMVLKRTLGEERRYQALLAQSEAGARSIRQQLYVLEGLGVSLTFSEALTLAGRVDMLTGVRPAFLLAIVKKESHWGGVQGTGVWRTDMHPRDHDAFVAITRELGVDPDRMPVSQKPDYGWGGAMGPAQFIPTTWLAYKEKIAKLTGHTPPNPWNVTDAFVAAGLKLAEAGATTRTAESEWKAAMIYFAGNNWQDDAYAFYGDAVMEYAAALQEEINVLKSNE